MSRTLTSLCLLALVALPLPAPRAQSAVVVPPAFDQLEANSRGFLAGFEDRFRQQVLVRGDLLSAAAGSQLTALWVRRDHALGKFYQGSTAQLRVTLSHARTSTGAPSATFAVNRGPSPVVVHDGPVVLPAGPAPQEPLQWRAPESVRIGFGTAFAYTGGDLCIELEGEPVAPGGTLLWSVDFVQEDTGTRKRILGAPCGVMAARNTTTANLQAHRVAVGSDIHITTIGLGGTAGLLILGSRSVTWPLDPLGATACTLYVSPDLMLPVVYPASFGGHLDTAAVTTLPLPSTSSFLAAKVYLQGVNLEGAPVSNPAGWTTTNGVEITLGAVMPPAAVSVVTSDVVGSGVAFPANGEVQVSRGPVFRFEYQ